MIILLKKLLPDKIVSLLTTIKVEMRNITVPKIIILFIIHKKDNTPIE